MPKHQVTLHDAGSGGGGDGEYETGATVTVRAGSRSGYTFAAWQPTGVTLTDPNSPEISFSMPDNDVTLVASWQITDASQPEHSHIWAAAWESSGTHHWHNCTAPDCPVAEDSEKDAYAAHTAGDWVVDRPATSTESGTRHKACTVCGYVMEQGTIPATGGGSSSGGGSSRSEERRVGKECGS